METHKKRIPDIEIQKKVPSGPLMKTRVGLGMNKLSEYRFRMCPVDAFVYGFSLEGCLVHECF